ncbi:hypothetical protein ACROYT_G017484 [Oculina patagonica]
MQIIYRKDNVVGRSSGKTIASVNFKEAVVVFGVSGSAKERYRLQISLVKLTVEETTSLESMYVKCGVFLLMLMFGIGYFLDPLRQIKADRRIANETFDLIQDTVVA